MKLRKRIRQWLLGRLIATSGADGVSRAVQLAIGRYRELFPQWDCYFVSLPRGENRAAEVEKITAFLKNHPEE